MPKRLLIAGAGHNQVRTIKQAVEMGLWVGAADANPNAEGLPHASAAFQADIGDADTLAAIARESGVHGIFPAAEMAVSAVAAACSRLGLPGIPPHVAERVRDKLEMREALARANIPNPSFRGVQSMEETALAVQEIQYPVILKPSDGNSSRGVRLVQVDEDLQPAFELAISESHSGIVLIEEFLDGEEFCVDGLNYHGNYTLGGITAKEISPPPNRFDLSIYMPPSEGTDFCAEIQTCAENALKAIGFKDGTSHVEIIVTRRGPRIVEIAGRPGGGRIPTDLIPIAYGYDFVADSLRIAIGEAPSQKRQYQRGAALSWIPAEPGEFHSIEGDVEAAALPGVRELIINVGPGQKIEPITDCTTRDRIGYILSEGPTGLEALETAHAARDLCTIVTKEPELQR